jgi:transposase
MSHLGTALKGDGRKREHDMHAIKRSSMNELRNGEPKGRKVIVAWDKAGIDFNFWHKAKQTSGLYFISREKENMKLIRCGHRFIDLEDVRNEGVTSDENVGPGGGAGAMLRRVGYTDPESGEQYVFITTEMSLEPGLLVLIYKHRWDIEKVFDELKNKLVEKKSWASSETAKTVQAEVLCLTHNLLIKLEELIETEETITNENEEKRKEKRRIEAVEKGSNYINTALRRSTVRSLKFIRWLRNFIYREVRWEHAIARLREVYEVF